MRWLTDSDVGFGCDLASRGRAGARDATMLIRRSYGSSPIDTGTPICTSPTIGRLAAGARFALKIAIESCSLEA
jgi:hypothetical protein